MSTETVSQQRPTGRRRITPAMARAQIVNSIMPMADARRGEIITSWKRAARILDVPRPVRELVLFLLSCTRAVDWEPGARPIAAPSNRDLADELDIGPTRIKALVRSAAELGLIECADSPTGRRYVRRGENGAVRYGYGFDLSPLSRRFDEWKAIVAAHEERRREGERLRRDIIVLRNSVLGLCDCAASAGIADATFDDLADQARQLAALRGEDRNPAHLAPIAQRLSAIRESAEQRISALLPVESDPLGSPDVAPTTTTNPTALANASEAAEPCRPSAIDDTGRLPGSSPRGTASQLDSPLRGFDAAPSLVLRIAPAFRDLCPSSRPTERQIVDAASLVAHSLGVSQHAWGQACSVLGRYGAAVALAVIAARVAQGKIRSPGGVLRAMTARHLAGELHLDRSLFGLIEELGFRGRT